MSDSDLDNELLAIAGQAKKKASRGKRRREDDSDEDVSFDAAEEEDEEEEWQVEPRAVAGTCSQGICQLPWLCSPFRQGSGTTRSPILSPACKGVP